MLETGYYHSPIGDLELVAEDGKLVSVNFGSMIPAEYSNPKKGVLATAMNQLDEYFAGKRKTFDLSLLFRGTDFQQKVWAELSHIPFGRTISYIDLARKLKKPGAVRAVGHANASNPLPLIIPCHRVIGNNGQLTGYAGGLWRKDWLLRFEHAGGQLSLFG